MQEWLCLGHGPRLSSRLEPPNPRERMSRRRASIANRVLWQGQSAGRVFESESAFSPYREVKWLKAKRAHLGFAAASPRAPPP